MLPDREAGTVEAWLSAHPDVTIIARDRGAGYGPAAARAAPQVMQVADRWHQMENASAAFLEVVRRSMRAIRQALGSTAINPALLSCAERLQYDGYLRREEAHGAIRALAGTGIPIKEMVRRTGRSRKLIRDILRRGGHDMFRCRTGMLQPHLTWLEAEWSGGCRNGAELWLGLRRMGFRGGLRVVTEWAATRRRRAEKTTGETARKVPPVRLIARLMTAMRDHLTTAHAMMDGGRRRKRRAGVGFR